MNSSLQKALSHLTEQENIEDVSVKFLENLVNKYPYFPIAHILLSKKLKDEGSEDYRKQVQKTALYFDNPYWLYYQLSSGIPDIVFSNGAEHLPEQDAGVGVADEDVQIVPDQFHPEPEVLQEEIESAGLLSDNFENGQASFVTASNVISLPGNEPQTINEPSSPNEMEEEEDQTTAGTGINLEDVSSIEVPKAVSISEEELEEDEKLIHEIAHPGENINTHEDASSTRESVSPALEEKVTSALESHHAFAKEMEARTRALVHPLDPTQADDHSISYEPYHTIDYFASQGIQLVLENNPQDKLGKQLKKFTQWLKHMKRLGPEDALNAVKDSHLENAIQGIADSSNTPRDVVTETMASVLEKQGKTEKAIELYTKLTFLNPDKSAYFAEKIQKLKAT